MITVMIPLKRSANGAFIHGLALARLLCQRVDFNVLIHTGPDVYTKQFDEPLSEEARRVQIITEKRAAMLPFCQGHAYFTDANIILPHTPLLVMLQNLIELPGIGAAAGIYHPGHLACGCFLVHAELISLINPLVADGCECAYIYGRIGSAGLKCLGVENAGIVHDPAFNAPGIPLDHNSGLGRLAPIEAAPGIHEISALNILQAVEAHGAHTWFRLPCD